MADNSSMKGNNLDEERNVETAMVVHDQHIADVTSRAYNELEALARRVPNSSAQQQQQLLHQHSSQGGGGALPKTNGSKPPATSSLFIPRSSKTSLGIRKPLARCNESELREILMRNTTLLRSQQVQNALGEARVDRIRRETQEVQDRLDALALPGNMGARDSASPFSTDHRQANVASRYQREGSTVRQMLQDEKPVPRRGKAQMISFEESEKLQRANFEAEQELERKRQLERIQQQMGRMDLDRQRSQYDRDRDRDIERDDDNDDSDDEDDDDGDRGRGDFGIEEDN